MKKALVAYFSASGVTAKLAERLADAIGADLSEIEPKARYTGADLDWRKTYTLADKRSFKDITIT